jgi:hypothetical protein
LFYSRNTDYKKGEKVTTAVKAIKEDLGTKYPNEKFSVRKVHAGTVYVFHNNNNQAFRTELGRYLAKFENWELFRTEYVFEAVA